MIPVTVMDSRVADLVDRGRELTPYAWEPRCPCAPLGPIEEETSAALARAREIYEVIVGSLPPELRT
jgi:hypothetical protein